MSDIKSYQRLLAVLALYETSINKKGIDLDFSELFSHIIESSNLKNKMKNSKLLLSKRICNGVFSNLNKIDLILKNSLKNKSKAKTLDKLLLSGKESIGYFRVFEHAFN